MSNQPYIGLRPFERNETDIFFGREQHSDELINRLGSNHFLAVIGTSGCGKSSLVKTGLVAGLEAGYLAKAGTHWHIVEMRPGQQPFYALAEKLLVELKQVLPVEETVETLAEKLRQGSLSLHELLAHYPLPNNAQLLIVCDQFEEIFRYFQHGESAEARNFVSLLLASSKPYPVSNAKVSNSVYVVITMRSDFLGDCAQFAGLAEAINQGLYLTPRLDAQQLRTAIEEPAFGFGGEVEPALVTQLLEDAGSNPDQLPLLQHVLMRLWDLATDNAAALTLADYNAVGGLANALSRHADEVYDELTNEQKLIAEVLFRNLTESDNGKRDTRRPLPLAEIIELTGTSFDAVVEVIDEFRQVGRFFLMPPMNVILHNDSVIDISHESLIRQWQRLKDWTEQEADSAKTYQRLEDRAVEWQKTKASLLQSPELEIYQQWWQGKKPTALWAKRYGEDFELAEKFLNTSQTVYKVQQQSKVSRLRWLIIGLISFSILVSGLAFWAWQESQHAEQQTALALESIKNLTYDLMGDLTKLNGTLPAIEKIIQSNIALLEKIDSPQALREKSVNANLLANVYWQLGDKQKALLWYEQSLSIFKQLAEQNSQNIAMQKDLFISLNRLADVYLQLGNQSKSSDYKQQAFETSQILPQDMQNKRNQLNSLVNFEKVDIDYYLVERPIQDKYRQKLEKNWISFLVNTSLLGKSEIIMPILIVISVLSIGSILFMFYFYSGVNYLKFIETILSVTVIFALFFIAIPQYQNYVEKAKNTQSISQVLGLKEEMVMYYAEHGVWPQSLDKLVLDSYTYENTYKEARLLENSTLVITREDKKTTQLSLKPMISKDSNNVESDYVLWLCGYAKASSSYLIDFDTELTTIPTAQLPGDCVN